MRYSVEQYLALGVITFILVGALTPVMRAIAIRIGAFDSPNIPRKIHKEPVPYLGGIAIVIGIVVVSYTAMLYSNFTLSNFALASSVLLPALAIAASVPLLQDRVRGRRISAAVVLFAGQVACIWALSDAFRTPFDGGQVTDRLAGEWLRTVSAPGDVVADRKPFVAFYAQRPHRILASGSYDASLDTLVHGGVRWLVLQDYVVHQMRPELAPLLDSASVRERETRVEMAYGRADRGDGSLAIFRVLHPGEPRTGHPPVTEIVGFGAADTPR